MREERRRELEFLEKVWKFDLMVAIYFLTALCSDYRNTLTFRVAILWTSNLEMELLLVSSLLHLLISIQNSL